MYMSRLYLNLGSSSRGATYLERAVQEVNCSSFSIMCSFVTLVVSLFGFQGRILVLIAQARKLHVTVYLSFNPSNLSNPSFKAPRLSN